MAHVSGQRILPRQRWLRDDRLYAGDGGRLFCGRLEHAGQAAYYTGRDWRGSDVVRVHEDAAARWGLRCPGCVAEEKSDSEGK